MRWIAIGIIAATALAGATIALASGSQRQTASVFKLLASDPRDSGGQLDFRAAKTLVSSGVPVGRNEVCKSTITTWGAWNPTLLHGGSYVPGKNKLEVLYAFNRDKKTDLTGYIIFAGRLGMYITTNDGKLAPVTVAKRTPATISLNLCDFRGVQIQPAVKSIHVAFLSVDGRHRDRMPNRGWVTLSK